MTHEHTMTLRGPALVGDGVSGHLLRDVVDVLVLGAEQSLRYRLEGRSSARGTPPAWLRTAADFQLLALVREADARRFHISASALIDSMPERFKQTEFFEDLDPRRSPLDLFEDALADAAAGKADSDAFDHPLLQTCAEFRSILGAGVDSIEFLNGRTLRLDDASLQEVSRLARQEYAPRRVCLAGRVDAIQYSDCRFTLVLADGSKVAGTARELGTEALRAAFGKTVAVTGTADFRPSGRLLRIDAEAVEDADERALAIFGKLPRPLQATPTAERPTPKRGLESLLGQWPGDESEELLLAQLGQLS